MFEFQNENREDENKIKISVIFSSREPNTAFLSFPSEMMIFL